MYDDDVQAPLGIGAIDRYYKVAKFPTRNIKTPILLVYGGSDSLVDIKVMLKELPRHTVAKEIPHFEHLDFLWGQEVDTLVFPYVFEALEVYAGRDHLKGFLRVSRLALAQGGEYSSDDVSSSITAGDTTDVGAGPNHRDENVATSQISPDSVKTVSPTAPSFDSAPGSYSQHEHPGTPLRSKFLEIEPSSTGSNTKHKRDSSRSSIRSVDNIQHFGERGISLRASKATVGAVSSPSDGSLSESQGKATKTRGRGR